MARPRENIIDIRSGITLADLEAIEASEPRNERRPDTLPLSAIVVADQVFQWRLMDRDIAASEDHVRELMRAARAQEGPLKALLLIPIGNKYYLVDGHHRLSAYRTMRWTKSVPVVWFEGSLHEARQKALESNAEDKRPLTREEKSEAAWVLVKEGALNAREITRLTSVGRGTIQSMRKSLRKLGKVAEGLTWAETRRHEWQPEEDYDANAKRLEKAHEIATMILNNTGLSIRRDPRPLADALEIIDSRIPDYMILKWAHRVGPLMDSHPEEFQLTEGELDI